MARLRNSTVALAAALFALVAQGAQAQTTSQGKAAGPAPARAAPAAPAPTAARIDPKALAVLKASCAALKNARTLSFTAVDTYERAARNGQPLYYTAKHEVILERPNKLKVVKVADGVPDEFYYDGKTVTAYVPSTNVAAVAEAPPTIDDMLSAAWEKAEIHFPFADVIVSDPCDVFDEGLRQAFYVGQSRVVGGTTTDMIAVTLDQVQGELWIGADDHLPRLVRTNYPQEPAGALYQTEYSDWRVDAPVPSSTFNAAKANAAKRIAFLAPSVAVPQPAGRPK